MKAPRLTAGPDGRGQAFEGQRVKPLLMIWGITPGIALGDERQASGRISTFTTDFSLRHPGTPSRARLGSL